MPSRSQIIAWKDEYEVIYETDICDETFIWRELTKAEFEKGKRYYHDEMEREEYVCTVCVLSPVDYDYSNCYAGIPSALTRLILRESGFTDGIGRQMFEYYRADMAEMEHQVAPIICAAFPNLSLEDVESWTVRKTMRYLSRAEWMLSTVHGSPIQITDQDQEPDYQAFPELLQRKKMMQQGRP